MPPFARLRHLLHAHSRLRRVAEGLSVALVVALACASLGRTAPVDALEKKTLDERFRWWADRKPEHPGIVVVELTDGDLQAAEDQGRGWPWARTAYGIAAVWLQEAGAKAVFLDFSFQDSHARYPKEDQKFVDMLKKADNTFVIATFDSPWQRHPGRIPALHARSPGAAPPWMEACRTIDGPVEEVIPAARGIVSPKYSRSEKDADGIFRRYPVGHAHGGRAFLSPAVALASEHLGQPVTFHDGGARIGDLEIPVDGDGLFAVDWHSGITDYNPDRYTLGGLIATRQGTAPKPYDPAAFRGKIVLIGASAEGLFDFKSTPTGTVLGVETHAAALDTILSRAFVRRLPGWAFALVVAGLACAAALAGLLLRIRWLLPLVLSLAVSHVLLAWWLLGAHHVWLDIVTPLATLVCATTGASLVNYAVEGRQKRDIRAKFGTYLTPEYVRLLEENPGMFALGGEERVGTAFFSDLSGFTAMSEKMTPAELVARMNEYLTLMTRSIKRFQGTVDKYEGDAIVAFWNAPVVQPDHALLACRAALDNQRELAKLRERWKAAFGVSVVARIGLNTGAMIFGNMGSEDKFNYTMMGDPVNLAARLESANKDYETFLMIGPGTYELVKDHMECRELDLIRVKGKQIPVTVYELLCEKGALDARTREMLDRYNLGLQAYRMKQFLAAERLFKEALEVVPDDGPSKLYVTRSQHLVAKPPEPGWTYIYDKKDK